MKSTYLVSLLSPRLPEGNGRLLPCCCLQYVKDRFFMRTRKTPFRSPAPGFFSESECKGTTIPRTDKIFPRFFFGKTQLFFRTPGRGTCKAGGRKHENGGVVQKNKENRNYFNHKRPILVFQNFTTSPFLSVLLLQVFL